MRIGLGFLEKEELAHSMLSLSVLTRLDLSGHVILVSLALCLRILHLSFSTSWHVLQSDNSLGAEEAQAMVPALCQMKQMRSLNLNSEGGEGLKSK